MIQIIDWFKAIGEKEIGMIIAGVVVLAGFILFRIIRKEYPRYKWEILGWK